MNQILIVEDNKDINSMLAQALQAAGYSVDSAFSGIEGINKINHFHYELILLDIMLPYKSGDKILNELRQFSDIPVIIVSAKDLTDTKIDFLRMGADDYITKPFDLDEVTARVEANLRRFQNTARKNHTLSYRDILIDQSAKRVVVNEVELRLTVKEYRLLELLLLYRDKVFTKANLYESVWHEEYLEDDNAVKTHMSHLRNKLKTASPRGEYIETVWGLGYRLYKE